MLQHSREPLDVVTKVIRRGNIQVEVLDTCQVREFTKV